MPFGSRCQRSRSSSSKTSLAEFRPRYVTVNFINGNNCSRTNQQTDLTSRQSVGQFRTIRRLARVSDRSPLLVLGNQSPTNSVAQPARPNVAEVQFVGAHHSFLEISARKRFLIRLTFARHD